MEKVNTKSKLYALEENLDKQKIEECLEGMGVNKIKSKVAIVVEDGGDNLSDTEYYVKGEDEPPEGMSYEEDGLLRVEAEKNGSVFQYSEAKQSEKGDSDLILVNTEFAHRTEIGNLLSGYDEDDVGPYIYVKNDNKKEFYGAFSPFINLEPLKGLYSVDDSLFLAEEGEPDEEIEVSGHLLSISYGSMKAVFKNKEEAEDTFLEAFQVLQIDDKWPPELKWYRRVALGTISVSDEVEVEKREEEVLDTRTFYDIPLDSGRNISFSELDDDDYLILGQSKKSHKDAKKVFDYVKELDGVEIKLENEGGMRNSLKFEDYKYPN